MHETSFSSPLSSRSQGSAASKSPGFWLANNDAKFQEHLTKQNDLRVKNELTQEWAEHKREAKRMEEEEEKKKREDELALLERQRIAQEKLDEEARLLDEKLRKEKAANEQEYLRAEKERKAREAAKKLEDDLSESKRKSRNIQDQKAEEKAKLQLESNELMLSTAEFKRLNREAMQEATSPSSLKHDREEWWEETKRFRALQEEKSKLDAASHKDETLAQIEARRLRRAQEQEQHKKWMEEDLKYTQDAGEKERLRREEEKAHKEELRRIAEQEAIEFKRLEKERKDAEAKAKMQDEIAEQERRSKLLTESKMSKSEKERQIKLDMYKEQAEIRKMMRSARSQETAFDVEGAKVQYELERRAKEAEELRKRRELEDRKQQARERLEMQREAKRQQEAEERAKSEAQFQHRKAMAAAEKARLEAEKKEKLEFRRQKAKEDLEYRRQQKLAATQQLKARQEDEVKEQITRSAKKAAVNRESAEQERGTSSRRSLDAAEFKRIQRKLEQEEKERERQELQAARDMEREHRERHAATQRALNTEKRTVVRQTTPRDAKKKDVRPQSRLSPANKENSGFGGPLQEKPTIVSDSVERKNEEERQMYEDVVADTSALNVSDEQPVVSQEEFSAKLEQAAD